MTKATLTTRLAILVVILIVGSSTGFALQETIEASAPIVGPMPVEAVATELDAGFDELNGIVDEEGGLQMTTAIEIAVLLTILTMLPAILISLTSFTRIVIVLSFVRRSLAVQELPPNPIIIGLALFLTTFVMGPVFMRVYDTAYVPYRAGEMDLEAAGDKAWGEMRTFLLANTRRSELEMFAEMAEIEPSVEDEGLVAEELPMRVVVPAFVLSELKTAFQMGFLLFLPFLVIDLVVASVLISMGMFMLPPIMISTPFKILLFVLVDGWHLVCESLVTSFVI